MIQEAHSFVGNKIKYVNLSSLSGILLGTLCLARALSPIGSCLIATLSILHTNCRGRYICAFLVMHRDVDTASMSV